MQHSQARVVSYRMVRFLWAASETMPV